ncbi:MAG: hypothetical protein ACYC0X_34245 [Pirellulaceae bacterium]
MSPRPTRSGQDERRWLEEQKNNRPYSELTCQRGRGILRAVVMPVVGAAKSGGLEPGNKRTILAACLVSLPDYDTGGEPLAASEPSCVP